MYFAACAIQSCANSYKINSEMTLVQKIRSGLAVTLIAVSSISTATVRTTGRAPWLGIVTYVIDGDTVQVRALQDGRPATIRINGIDAPEICQSGGAMARHVRMQRILYKEVLIYGKASRCLWPSRRANRSQGRRPRRIDGRQWTGVGESLSKQCQRLSHATAYCSSFESRNFHFRG